MRTMWCSSLASHLLKGGEGENIITNEQQMRASGDQG